MEDDKNRVLILMPGIIIFSVLLFISIALIPLLVFTVECIDAEFWAVFFVIILICSFFIWGLIVTCQYVDINFNEIKLVSYKGIYCIRTCDIELVEIRKSSIGHVNIIIKTKEPVQLVKKNNKQKNKFMEIFYFVHSEKFVRILKHYISEEVPWIYNDYFKNPNLEPKKPKKK